VSEWLIRSTFRIQYLNGHQTAAENRRTPDHPGFRMLAIFGFFLDAATARQVRLIEGIQNSFAIISQTRSLLKTINKANTVLIGKIILSSHGPPCPLGPLHEILL